MMVSFTGFPPLGYPACRLFSCSECGPSSTDTLLFLFETGYAYYGEYPASFAACFDNKEMYDYLIRKGADPNKQDTFGSTVLHLCVIHNKIVSGS